MHHFMIADGEIIYGQIIGRYGRGYDVIYIVQCANGYSNHIHQSFRLD